MKKTYYDKDKLFSYNNGWYYIFISLGLRAIGKTYSAKKLTCKFYNKIRNIPENPENVGDMFLWLRLTRTAIQKYKNNILDGDLIRKYKITPTAKGDKIYYNGRHVGHALSISDAPNIKGGGFDWKRYKYVFIDEFQRELNERKTFDLNANLMSILESVCRLSIREMNGINLPIVFLMGNKLDEITDILYNLDFIPTKHGIYKFKKQRTVVEYIDPHAYKKRNSNVYELFDNETNMSFDNKKTPTTYNIAHYSKMGHLKFLGQVYLTTYISLNVFYATDKDLIYITNELNNHIPKRNKFRRYCLNKELANKNGISYYPEFATNIIKAFELNRIYFNKKVVAHTFNSHI